VAANPQTKPIDLGCIFQHVAERQILHVSHSTYCKGRSQDFVKGTEVPSGVEGQSHKTRNNSQKLYFKTAKNTKK